MIEKREVLFRLGRIVRPDALLSDPVAIASFAVDWTGRFKGNALAVVCPSSTAEVAEIVALCRELSLGLVPQGGNSGLVGGAVPHDDIVLSTLRMRTCDPVNLADSTVVVDAGVTLSELSAHVLSSGLRVGVDFGAREMATIGGMVATNAGGMQVLRFGTTRRSVVGIEAVLGDESVVSRLLGLDKDNTGFDLAGLLCGSEGTLGIITRVQLRLQPAVRYRCTAALGFASIEAAVAGVGILRMVPSLEACEVMFADGLVFVSEYLGEPVPSALRAPVCVLIEAAGHADPTEELQEAIEHLGEVVGDGLLHVLVAPTPNAARQLWRWRESHTASLNSVGVPIKLDVSVPRTAMATVLAALPAVLDQAAAAAAAQPGRNLKAIVFGHLGDGNLHINISGALNHDAAIAEDELAALIELGVLTLVVRHGGSISAEHGIGQAKAKYAYLSRSEAEQQAFASIRNALDPSRILNRHVGIGICSAVGVPGHDTGAR